MKSFIKRGVYALILLALSAQSSAFGFKLSDRTLPYLAPDTVFTSQGKPHSLKQYRGRKVMLWMFSTWCHTCAAGVKYLVKNQTVWSENGLIILAIRNHKNHGNAGMQIETFIKRFGGPEPDNKLGWVLGEASESMDLLYNKRKYPDIYFLIDEKGMVQEIGTAPHLYIKKIVQFSKDVKR